MAFTYLTRPLTAHERQHLQKSSRLSFDDWTWVVVPGPSFGFSGYMLGRCVEWLFPVVPTGLAIPILAVVGGVIGLLHSLSFFRTLAGVANASKTDLLNDIVQVIHAWDVVVIEQQEFNSEGPILFFKLNSETILFLWGQWIYDSHIYGAENRTITDESQTFLNAQEREFAFPCTEFTIHRTPNLGRILKIETNGEPLQPIKTLPFLKIPLQDFCDSEILKGSLDDLNVAMEKCNRVLQPGIAT